MLDALERHGSLWLSYPSPGDPQGSEYTRAYMLLRDGYVLASGYGMDADVRLQSLVDESVRLYERRETPRLAPSRQWARPGSRYTTCKSTRRWPIPSRRNSWGLPSRPPPWGLAAIWRGSCNCTNREGRGPTSSRPARAAGSCARTAWSVLHDGHLFGASRAYSPEAAAAAEVEAAPSACTRRTGRRRLTA